MAENLMSQEQYNFYYNNINEFRKIRENKELFSQYIRTSVEYSYKNEYDSALEFYSITDAPK